MEATVEEGPEMEEAIVEEGPGMEEAMKMEAEMQTDPLTSRRPKAQTMLDHHLESTTWPDRPCPGGSHDHQPRTLWTDPMHLVPPQWALDWVEAMIPELMARVLDLLDLLDLLDCPRAPTHPIGRT